MMKFLSAMVGKGSGLSKSKLLTWNLSRLHVHTCAHSPAPQQQEGGETGCRAAGELLQTPVTPELLFG